MTNATWIRKFIHEHPDYKHDSVISETTAYDLVRKIKDVSEGTITCPELTGKLKSMASLKRQPCPEPFVNQQGKSPSQ